MDLNALFEQCIAIDADGAEWAKAVPGGGGVYALTDEHDTLILIASGEGLRRTITYRLSPPPEASKKRADLRAVTRRVRWRRTYSAFETAFEFHRIARMLMPNDYMELCAFGPAWFVHVDVTERLPRLLATKYLRTPGTNIGPFPTKNAAERFVEMLEDLFDLCRHYHILEQAPHGQACAYAEMGKCPAPCDGSIPLDEYQRMMAAAVSFGTGGWQSEVPHWRDAMMERAAAQDFEQANSFKQRIKRAEPLAGESCRFARPIEQFSCLIIQRAEGRARVKPYFVRAGQIDAGESVKRKDLPEAAKRWVETMSAPPPPLTEDNAALRSEWTWLVSHYLFKGDRAPGLFMPPDEWPNPDRWLPLIEERVLRLETNTTPASDTNDKDLPS
ncbi:MAG: hypothetical protein JXA69_15965 [Phycisphaerae bacterium]|nr:hypothetical protein [Phycisphaerae bacterium]